MIMVYLKVKIVGSLDTGLNIVHVRDVARGHILAGDRGKAGQKYVLGNRNMALIEIFRALASFTGVRAPRFRVPYGAAWLAASCMERAARVTGGAPEVARAAVRMARKRRYFTAATAA